MIAAEMAVGDYVQSLRKEEVGISRSVRKLGTLTTAAREYPIDPTNKTLIFHRSLTMSSFDELCHNARRDHGGWSILEGFHRRPRCNKNFYRPGLCLSRLTAYGGVFNFLVRDCRSY